jgi:hypothetical protein
VRPSGRASIQAGFGLGLVAPVRARIADGVEVTDRDVDPEVIVFAPRFEQQDRFLRIRGESVREQATGRACAHDDVVELAD